MRDYTAAVDVLKKALALKPENTQIKRALAQDLLFSEQYDEALALYTGLAEDESSDGQIQMRIAEIYRRKRAFDKAHAALAKAKEIDKNSIEVRYEEVNLLDSEGKSEEAIGVLKGILEETAKRNYTNGEKVSRFMLIERLGELYRDTRQYAKAVEVTRQIAEIDPAEGPRVSGIIVLTYRTGNDLAAAQAEADAAL